MKAYKGLTEFDQLLNDAVLGTAVDGLAEDVLASDRGDESLGIGSMTEWRFN